MKKTFLLSLLALLGLGQALAQREGYLPIVREGVTWVNEKVIVNNGDTTRYYYKYEFSGRDTAAWHNNYALYYYTGDSLDVECDSLIAGMLEGYYGYYVTCFRNYPLKKQWWDGLRMLQFDGLNDGGTTLLYIFDVDGYGCDDYYLRLTEFGVSYGLEPFLTSDNFVKVDPIIIEDTECERYVYIDERGDTLAYVVEGIGFDSRDLGDLLAPFTRRPDPTDDYQEWCGLSHVVKDGEVIYWGMRSREMVSHEIVVEEPDSTKDPNYYDLTGRCWGTEIPKASGIFIHRGEKICVGLMP